MVCLPPSARLGEAVAAVDGAQTPQIGEGHPLEDGAHREVPLEDELEREVADEGEAATPGRLDLMQSHRRTITRQTPTYIAITPMLEPVAAMDRLVRMWTTAGGRTPRRGQ